MIAAAGDILAWAAWAGALLGGLVLCALYSGLETGTYVVNKIRMDLRAEAGSRAAKILRRQWQNPRNLLAVLLVGTNFAAYLATFAVSAMFVRAGMAGRAEWYTLALATPLLFILGESVPKNVFRRLAETLVYRLAWLLQLSSVVFNACGLVPLIRAFSWLILRCVPRRRAPARDALSTIVAEGTASGVLTHFQSVMADRVMNIARVTLDDVMIPMARVARAPGEVGRDEFLALACGHDYSRVPLLDEAGQVVAVVVVQDVLADRGGADPATIAAVPLVLPAAMTVTDALYRMQRAHAALAVVEDPSRKHLGIVTVKDLVEEIVGELAQW